MTTTLAQPADSATPSRLYDRNFALAVAGQTCFVIANTLMAHYARWIEFLGGDLRQVGLVMGLGSLMGLVLRPWMAQWMNRLGARTMWAIGYGVFAVSSLSNLLLYELSPLIYVCRSGVVLGVAIVFASGLTYISQIAPAPRRAEAIGILGVGGFLGMLVGPLLGDLVLGLDDRQRGDFVVFFVVAAVANLVPALLLFFIRAPERSPDPVTIRLAEFLTTVRRHWPGSILLVDLAFGVCMTGPFVFVASFIDGEPLHIEGVSMLGLFFWFYAGPAILIRVFGRRWPEQWGTRRVLIIGGVLMSIGMLAFGMVDSDHPWLILLPAVLAGSGHSLMFHTMTALTLETFPTAVRGTGAALALMMLDLGTIGGAPVLGTIGEHFGFASLFASIAGISFFAVTIYAIATRNTGIR
ncbi:MAG: MFS transporter [Pirellulaceae bacterium]|nr:MFS transporter [Pirellulaceae bacterium]